MLREALGISDSALSKHIKQLEDAGYLRLRRATLNGRRRTWAQLTPTGRRAFAAHVEALMEIASLARTSQHLPPPGLRPHQRPDEPNLRLRTTDVSTTRAEEYGHPCT
ncbi:MULTISPECIES: transcriptional regulator [unclassified Solwaraspora]|uniref:transcriptional regulator n=1 Tax=unclassified Solwaraspora TaxID=2627926 RepID=UPI00248C127B|nr:MULTISPECIES: transcriptional regulator [unclassified Solwaraspora]WBB96716.1 transcriptional regulator [Solwaraspora sp. WMMA2059]WBC19380.1 transcriptional regulator [Solwaraspora sp. WMMA2080]WJK33037.1 transcriptional regulator [Solwaraspora sp. WMMA2065]